MQVKITKEIDDPRVYDIKYGFNETLEDSKFLLNLPENFDAVAAAKKLDAKLCPYASPIKSSIIDIAIAVREVLGVQQYIGDPSSRKTIGNAVKEAYEIAGKIDCETIIERLMLRRNTLLKNK
ncbi:hypothetical protein JW911_02720 [Candidatus Peregrinibacteria bacterium]|nr:hypothetical protein [Candidatus Peregrinibacteria bacterium]